MVTARWTMSIFQIVQEEAFKIQMSMTENKDAFKAPVSDKSGVRVEPRMDGTEHWMSQAAH